MTLQQLRYVIEVAKTGSMNVVVKQLFVSQPSLYMAIREARTHDVVTGKSEIGILYTNEFNEKVLNKIFKDNQLEFIHLFTCQGYAYLWKNHPLAGKKL